MSGFLEYALGVFLVVCALAVAALTVSIIVMTWRNK